MKGLPCTRFEQFLARTHRILEVFDVGFAYFLSVFRGDAIEQISDHWHRLGSQEIVMRPVSWRCELGAAQPRDA